jgi:hypothetical protein
MPDFQIDAEFRDLFRPLTVRERRELTKLIARDGPKDHSLVVGVFPDGTRILLDGHNTNAVCHELRIPLPRIREIKIGSRAEAVEWIIRNQGARRNLAAKVLARLRQERIVRVAEARQEGMSTRQIGEAEGISQTQVQKDLKEAGEHGCSPVPPDGKVTGRDGRKQAANKTDRGLPLDEDDDPEPLVCERCQRVNGGVSVADCGRCFDLNNRNRKPKRKRSGQVVVTFDWDDFYRHYGHVVVRISACGHACGDSHLAEQAHAAMKQVMERLSAMWKSHHGKEPPAHCKTRAN